MWIRTECGIITKINLLTQHLNDIKEGVVDLCDEILKIKKQGDNLIDVLEVNDIVYSFDTAYFITNFYDNTIWEDGVMIKDENITKVITHEQYMPLAQEIK